MVFRIIWRLRWLPLLLFPFLLVDYLRNRDYSNIYKKIGWSVVLLQPIADYFKCDALCVGNRICAGD